MYDEGVADLTALTYCRTAGSQVIEKVTLFSERLAVVSEIIAVPELVI